MTPTETAAKLRNYNTWRRGNLEWMPQPDPREIGEAIDAAVEMIERLEAAEKSDAESLAMYRKARDERDALRAAVRHEADCVEAAKAEIKALRAKIEQMEEQEPVGKIVAFGESLHEPSWRGGRLPPLMTELYALPGAKGK